MDNIEKNINNNIEQIKKICFWRTAFFGLIILCAGIVIGGASMSIVLTHNMIPSAPQREFESLMPRLNQILGLTQQQSNKIKPILDGYMQHLQEIREDARVEIMDTLEQMNNEIMPILAERQRIVWSGELVRIQRNLNPEAHRAGGGSGFRRGAEQLPGQGIRRGGRGNPQRLGPRQNRRFEPQPLQNGPNSFFNDINDNAIIRDNIDYNNIAK